MARRGRRRRHRRMASWRKWAKTILGVTGVAVGAGVAFSPTYRGLTTAIVGRNPQEGFAEIAYDTTGIDPRVGNPPDLGKVFSTALTVAVGIGLIALFRAVAKRV